jgi:ABC-type lipoprotein release transport system permease subunit
MLSVSMYIVMDGWIIGLQTASRRSIVNYETGAAKLQSQAYVEKLDDLPVYESFDGWQTYAAMLDEAGYDAAPRFVFTGTMLCTEGSAPMKFIACDPNREAALLHWTDFIESGRNIRNGEFAIVVGAVTADKLGISENGNLTLTNGNVPGVRISTEIEIKDEQGIVRRVYQVIDAVVVGIVNSPAPQNNNNIAWIPLDVLQGEEGMMLEGKVTELLIREKNASDAKLPGENETPHTISAVLESVLPDELAVYDWKTYVRGYMNAEKVDDIVGRMLVIILFILSFLGIANTMLLSILERTREIAMLRAQGMSDSDLILTYMLEAGMIGFLGACSGILIGCLINIRLVNIGVDLTATYEQMSNSGVGYRIRGIFHGAWNVPAIISTGVVAIVIPAISAFFPIHRTLKMSITDSLRFE